MVVLGYVTLKVAKEAESQRVLEIQPFYCDEVASYLRGTLPKADTVVVESDFVGVVREGVHA